MWSLICYLWYKCMTGAVAEVIKLATASISSVLRSYFVCLFLYVNHFITFIFVNKKHFEKFNASPPSPHNFSTGGRITFCGAVHSFAAQYQNVNLLQITEKLIFMNSHKLLRGETFTWLRSPKWIRRPSVQRLNWL